MSVKPTLNKKPLTHWFWPLRWRPLLDAWVDIGLLQVQTSVWREQFNFDGIDYMIVEVRILRKWGFRFCLYDTSMRRIDR